MRDGEFLELGYLKVENAGNNAHNVFILKLNSSSPDAFNILDEIRQYNKKSFLLVFIDNENVFLQLKNRILAPYIFNIYLVNQSFKSKVYFIYEVCAYCEGGKHQLRVSNTWKNSRGFNTSFKFTSSFKGQFFNAELKVALRMIPPNTFLDGVSSEGDPLYGGWDYWFIEAMAKSLKFKIEIAEPKHGTSCYYQKETRSVTGLCGMLYRKEVDYVAFPTIASYSQNYFFDPTSVLHIVHNRIISANPEANVKIAYSFNGSMLIIILLLSILFSFLLFLVERFQGSKNINRSIRGSLYIFGIFCREPIRFRNLRLRNQIVMGLWLVCCFTLISNYFGDVTSATAIKNHLQTT